MEKTITQHVVFRVLKRIQGTESWRYMKSARYASEISYTDTPKDAQHFDITDAEEIIKVYDILQKQRQSGEKVEFVKVTIETIIDQISLSEGEFLEERRKNALAKLTPDDIQVLDLGKLASYDKLKFHPVKKGS